MNDGATDKLGNLGRRTRQAWHGLLPKARAGCKPASRVWVQVVRDCSLDAGRRRELRTPLLRRRVMRRKSFRRRSAFTLIEVLLRRLRHHRPYDKHLFAGRKVQAKSRRLSGIPKPVFVVRTQHASCASVAGRDVSAYSQRTLRRGLRTDGGLAVFPLSSLEIVINRPVSYSRTQLIRSSSILSCSSGDGNLSGSRGRLRQFATHAATPGSRNFSSVQCGNADSTSSGG